MKLFETSAAVLAAAADGAEQCCAEGGANAQGAHTLLIRIGDKMIEWALVTRHRACSIHAALLCVVVKFLTCDTCTVCVCDLIKSWFIAKQVGSVSEPLAALF